MDTRLNGSPVGVPAVPLANSDGIKCSEFYSYVLSDSKVLSAAASGRKYYGTGEKRAQTQRLLAVPRPTDFH